MAMDPGVLLLEPVNGTDALLLEPNDGSLLLLEGESTSMPVSDFMEVTSMLSTDELYIVRSAVSKKITFANAF